MTMLASWAGIDTHGISSVYIASDSRFSWNFGVNHKIYDHGKKLYAVCNFPELFGYCGDVLFPTIVIQQIIEMVENDLLLSDDMTCQEKNKIVFDKISYELNHYPISISCKEFQILHITRDTVVQKSLYPKFHAFFLSYAKGKWERIELEIPIASGLICVLGSGKSEFLNNYSRYQDGQNRNTSRNVFHCFIDTLTNTKDSSFGGSPQLVGLIRKPNSFGQYYGILFGKKRFFNGTEIPQESFYGGIPWRNECFEICNGNTKHIAIGAQPQPDPLRRN